MCFADSALGIRTDLNRMVDILPSTVLPVRKVSSTSCRRALNERHCDSRKEPEQELDICRLWVASQLLLTVALRTGSMLRGKASLRHGTYGTDPPGTQARSRIWCERAARPQRG